MHVIRAEQEVAGAPSGTRPRGLSLSEKGRWPAPG